MASRSRGIKGITKNSLYAAWREIRTELRRSQYRDVVDHLEYDIEPDVWIRRLLRKIANGTYDASPPQRFTLAKSKGFSRRMAFPHIQDLVLYRACVDSLYRSARKREYKHVYFEQKKLSEAQAKAVEDATPAKMKDPFWQFLNDHFLDYSSESTKRFRAWLKYDQYRKYLIFKKIYPFIVVTDITNFFDSVLYTHIAEALHAVPAPSRLVGLLFLLLEKLSYRGGIRESPRVGLPVDEFDCSRKLAHMVLFPHDDNMVETLGEDAYLRWMDDQNFGVNSRSEGLQALASLGLSLSQLHLTPNAGKTQILTLSEAKVHFHLDANKLLDDLEKMPHGTRAERRILSRKCHEVWKKARKHEGRGNWDKVLKRIYRHAGLSGARFMRRRATKDLLHHASLTDRVADYMRATGTVEEYLNFIEHIWTNPEQVYGDVNLVLVESLLRLEPNAAERIRIRSIASDLLNRKLKFAGAENCATVAPLLILRYGDRRSLPLLKRVFKKECDQWPSSVVRSAAIVYSTFGRKEYQEMKRSAVKIWRNPLEGIVRLVDRVLDYDDVPKRFKSRFSLRRDSVSGYQYLDMRTVVTARLLKLNKTSLVRAWIDGESFKWKSMKITDYDKRLVEALVER